MVNSQSSQLMKRARHHLNSAERMMQRASAVPNWATELLEGLRCILDAGEASAPAVMVSARRAQEGQTDGKP